MQQGWIKIYRDIANWRYYDDDFMYRFFTTLIADANISEKEWQGIKVSRGQLVTSLKHLSFQFGKSVKRIRTALSKMKGNELEIETNNRFTIITIVNYDSYQVAENESGTKLERNWNEIGHEKGTPRARQNDDITDSVIYNYDDEKKDVMNEKGTPRARQGHAKGTPRATTKEYKKERSKEESKEIHTNVCKEKKSISDAEIFSDEKNSGNNDQLISEEEEKEKKVAPKRESRFVPPTLEEVKDYEAQKGYTFSAEKFWGYYESNGWRVGKNPMKSWHGACVTWQGKQNEENNNLNLNNNATIQSTGGRASADEPEWLRHQRENEEYLQYHLKRAMSKINTKDDDKDVNGIF